MAIYTHLLFAVDLHGDTLLMMEKVKQLAKQNGAKLSLLHVVEMVPVGLYNEVIEPPQIEIEQQLARNAEEKLKQLARSHNLDEDNVHVEIGVAKWQLLEFASQQQVDLIVLGNHSRHGFSRLLGSTANAVLSHAECDVLALQLNKQQ